VRARALTLRAASRGRRVRLSGRLALPAGVAACSGVVRVDVRRAGAVVARAGTKLRAGKRGCTYARTLAIPARAAGARLTAAARFAGNEKLLPHRARAVGFRAS